MIRLTLIFFLTINTFIDLKGQNDSSVVKHVEKIFDSYYNIIENSSDSIFIYLDSAYALSKKHSYHKGMTDALREKSYIYSERGDYLKAMQFAFEALRFDEKVKNTDGAASDLNLIGLIYNQQEKLDEALSYFIKARDKFMELNDKLGIAMVTVNMGMIYRNKNNFDLALKCYFISREYYLNDKSDYNLINVANLENNIGNVYKDLKEYDKALEYLFKAKEGKAKFKQYTSLVSTLSNIADIYVDKKKFDEALVYYNEAMALAKSQNSIRLQKDVYFDLSVLYREKGNYKLAYENYKLSTHLKDSIITEKNNNQIAELNVKYETEKKDNENKILIKDNELQVTRTENERKQKLLFAALSILILLAGVFVFIQFRAKQKLSKQLAQINEKIKNQNITLKTLNKELIDSEENLTIANSSKDQLISMLSHDLYNPITSVINYTNLTLETAEKLTKEDLQKSLISVNNAVLPLQDLLDNILQWARTQKSNLRAHVELIDLNMVISDIIKLYQPLANFKQIKIFYNSLSKIDFNSDRLMIYFILRNILNNAVKFSPKGKEIFIETSVSGNSVKILIRDQGNGFKEEILAQLNNRSQFQLEGQVSGSGIGLSVSRKFMELLNGEIVFSNYQEGGAEIKLTFHQA